MNPFVIHRISVDYWKEFRTLRLDALRTDPLAFGSTVERESAYTDDRWREWTRRGAEGEREATFIATGGTDGLVGMTGVFTVDRECHLWGMWVHPRQRGRGIGGRLLDATLEWIDRAGPESRVVLDVNPDQARAVALYRSRGFQFTEKETALGHDAPAIVRQMVRRGPSPSPRGRPTGFDGG